MSIRRKKSRNAGFVDDPGAGQQQQPGFDERRKVFNFTVAVLMVGIGGLVGNADRKKVSSEAIRSSPECAASERIPRLPVLNPTTTLRPVMTTAARTEFPAAARFSERIKSDEEMAGLPDMQELSPLRVESAK